jgi:eukaryotic-like serine/threonine-protein kinase
VSDGGSGGPHEPYDIEGFHTSPYPQPPIIWAPTPARPINVFATLSVVFAFLFAPLGAVFGHLGLLQIRLRGERGRERAVIGLTLSYVFTFIALVALVIWTVVGTRTGTSSTVATSPTSAAIPTAATSSVPEQPLVMAAQLPKLLLSIDDVKHAVNAPNLAKVDDAAGLIGTQGVTVTPSECLSALFASTKQAYEHSPVRGIFSRAITGEGQAGMVILNETMSTFENASAATSLVSQIVGEWRGCAGKSVTMAGDGSTITLDVGDPEANGTVMTLQNSLRGSLPGFSSDRAIVAKANVVIDLDAQGFYMGDSLKRLADQILTRVPS